MRREHEPLDAYWGERLIRALRCGRYSQAHGRTRSADGEWHCALGVLIDLGVQDGLVSWERSDMRVGDLMRRAMSAHTQYQVVGWNDHDQDDFATIADKLEQLLPPREPVTVPEAVDAGALAEPDLVAV